MRDRILVTFAALLVRAFAALANAVFYLTDPARPLFPGDSPRPPILLGMVIYLVLGLAAHSQRRSPFGSFWTRACVLAAACFLWFGPGQDWYGSRQDPAYYNRVMRLGFFFGRMGQLVCVVAAVAGVLVGWVVNRLNGQGSADGM